jgi:hypothetical protein
MQLRNARLCLDCEELHGSQQCPVCASESFAFLTRWIPVDERRQQGRSRARSRADAAHANGGNRAGRGGWVMGGAAGVALFALSRFLMRTARPAEWEEPSADGTPRPDSKDYSARS